MPQSTMFPGTIASSSQPNHAVRPLPRGSQQPQPSNHPPPSTPTISTPNPAMTSSTLSRTPSTHLAASQTLYFNSQQPFPPFSTPSMSNETSRGVSTFPDGSARMMSVISTVGRETSVMTTSGREGTAGLSEQRSTNRNQRSNASWSEDDDAVMLNVLSDAAVAGKRADNGFKKTTWEEVALQVNAIRQRGGLKDVRSCKGRLNTVSRKERYRVDLLY